MHLGISDFSTTNDLYGAQHHVLFIVCLCVCARVRLSKCMSLCALHQCMHAVRACVCVCVCWSIVTFSCVRCVCAETEKYSPLKASFSKTLQIHKHFRAVTTLTDSWIPVFWINFTSHHVRIHSYEQAFSLRLSRLYDGIAGIPGAKWTGTATLLNAR